MSNLVELNCHLIVAATLRGDGEGAWQTGKAHVRVSKSKPSLRANEVAIALSLKIPVALFQRPQLRAAITVPAERAPFVITPEIESNIAEAVRAATGLELELAVKGPQDQ